MIKDMLAAGAHLEQMSTSLVVKMIKQKAQWNHSRQANTLTVLYRYSGKSLNYLSKTIFLVMIPQYAP